MKISVAMIREKKPCYNPVLIGGITEATEMTLIEWLKYYKDKKLTNADKVWLATRFMSDLQNRTFAIWCARSCKTEVKEIGLYIDAIENYYIKKTGTKEQMEAADSAAYSAADWAAYNAADRAADSAADRAAYSAADRAADRAAYSAADRAADRAADWAKQVKQIIKISKIRGEV